MRSRWYLFIGFLLLFYAISYSILRNHQEHSWAGILNLVVQVALDLGAALLAIALLRRVPSDHEQTSAFLLILITVSLVGVLSDGAYGYVVNVRGESTDPSSFASLAVLYLGAYAAFLLLWSIAWSVAAYNAIRHQPLELRLTIAACAAALALASLFIISYVELLHQSQLSQSAKTFHLVFTLLQTAGLLAGLTALMCGLGRLYVVIFLGYSVQVSTDFILRGSEISSALSPVHFLELGWTLGLATIVLGLLATWLATRHGREIESLDIYGDSFGRARITGMLALCAILPMAVMLFANTIVAHVLYRSAILVQITVYSVVAVTLLARKSGLAIDHLVKSLDEEFSGNQQAHPPGLLGLAWRLMSLDRIAREVRRRVNLLAKRSIALGPDMLFPVDKSITETAEGYAFVIMPFMEAWSHQTYSIIKETLGNVEVRCVRADEIFHTGDLVIDIWRGISRACLIISDLTGRNPNVMYETGIAHAIGKPTVLLCQSSGDIPFNLSTKRAIIYGSDDREAGSAERLREALEKVVREIMHLRQRGAVG